MLHNLVALIVSVIVFVIVFVWTFTQSREVDQRSLVKQGDQIGRISTLGCFFEN
jgi:hypothetical protein